VVQQGTGSVGSQVCCCLAVAAAAEAADAHACRGPHTSLALTDCRCLWHPSTTTHTGPAA
jgi:hypothetical protein